MFVLKFLWNQNRLKVMRLWKLPLELIRITSFLEVVMSFSTLDVPHCDVAGLLTQLRLWIFWVCPIVGIFRYSVHVFLPDRFVSGYFLCWRQLLFDSHVYVLNIKKMGQSNMGNILWYSRDTVVLQIITRKARPDVSNALEMFWQKLGRKR